MPKIYHDILMKETTYSDKILQIKRIREREFIKKSKKLYHLVVKY